MTANAMQGDREKCLEAGMNDYVSKPIDPRVLTEALDKWLPQAVPPQTSHLIVINHQPLAGLHDKAAEKGGKADRCRSMNSGANRAIPFSIFFQAA